MSKVIIAGSRNFNDYELLKTQLTYFVRDLNNVEIVSGHARGADMLGERYAKEKGLPLHLFPADWNKLGKQAGYIRNAEMASFASHLIAFWDGKSKGTKMMIDIANKKGLSIEIVQYEQNNILRKN